jgi:signal transduction histidine kinase
MNPETVEKIFDPFFSTRFIGRGLGLSVVLGIVKAHDGAVSVETHSGSGSIFRIFLPVIDEIPLFEKHDMVKTEI